MGPPPITVTVSPISTPGLVQPAKHAGQWLNHRRLFIAHIGRDRQHVDLDDASRNANVFRISPIVEQKIFTKIGLVFRAIKTHLARRGVQRHHPHPLLEPAHTRPNFLDHSSQFVPKQRGRNNHARVVSALVDLEIRPTSQGDLHFYQHFAFAHSGDGNAFDFYVLFAVEDRCRHLSVQFLFPSHELPA